jgi:divalent metal cation (Fe/Co/Zn/Cd) transporter
MAFYNKRIGKKINSAAMNATCVDSVSDAAATSIVLISAVIRYTTGVIIDGWSGLLIALFIFYGGIKSMHYMVDLLLGTHPEPDIYGQVKNIIREHPEVLGIHDLMIHDYGPGRRIIMFHAEVNAGADFLQTHDIIDNIEKELHEKLSSITSIHMDPIVTDDSLTDDLKLCVTDIIANIDASITMHDFRIVPGPTHTNIIFDINVPFSLKLSEKGVKKQIESTIHDMDNRYYAVVTVDRTNFI